MTSDAVTATITGGTLTGVGLTKDFAGIVAAGASRITINGAGVAITGPVGLKAYDSSLITLSNGGITGGVYLYDDTIFNMSGGKIDEYFLFDNAVANISGGKIGGNTLYNLHSSMNDRARVQPVRQRISTFRGANRRTRRILRRLLGSDRNAF